MIMMAEALVVEFVDVDADDTEADQVVNIYHDNIKIDVYAGPTDCDDSKQVKVGDQLGMHYTGTIDQSSQTGTWGKQFDSSRDRGIMLDIKHIGFGTLIDGWDHGLLGLCQGAQAILIVPPELAYGSNGVGDMIPPYATLKFDIEIVTIHKHPPHPNLFDELDTNNDNVLTVEEILVHFRKHEQHQENEADADAVELPEHLMENSDTNKDGVISRTEFGSPEMSFDMCLEMLHHHPPDDESNTLLGLSIQWLCYRPRNNNDKSNDDDYDVNNNGGVNNSKIGNNDDGEL